MLLTVEYNGSEVEIRCDLEGLKALRKRLGELRRGGAPGRAHLMTGAWGGEGLTAEQAGDVRDWINHLIITLLAADEAARQEDGVR